MEKRLHTQFEEFKEAFGLSKIFKKEDKQAKIKEFVEDLKGDRKQVKELEKRCNEFINEVDSRKGSRAMMVKNLTNCIKNNTPCTDDIEIEVARCILKSPTVKKENGIWVDKATWGGNTSVVAEQIASDNPYWMRKGLIQKPYRTALIFTTKEQSKSKVSLEKALEIGTVKYFDNTDLAETYLVRHKDNITSHFIMGEDILKDKSIDKNNL